VGHPKPFCSVHLRATRPVEDGGRGFAGDGLAGDGFEERFVGGLRGVHLGVELGGFGNEGGEFFILCSEVARGFC